MMDIQSMEYIYTSWDHIKSLPNYQQEFGVSLFSRIHALSKRMGPMFYKDGKADRSHARLFTQMMDLIVHMLGPDMDSVIEQLEDLGERHAESFGVTSRHYPVFGEALLDTLELFLGRHWKPAVGEAWTNLFRIMSMTMLTGGRRVIRRRKKEQKRLEKQQRLEEMGLTKPQRSPEDGPADLTESSSSLTSLSMSGSHQSGHASSSSCLILSDEEEVDLTPPSRSPLGLGRKRRGGKKKKKMKKSADISDDDLEDERKPSSLNDITSVESEEEEQTKPSSFCMGRSMRPGSRKSRPGMARAESCRLAPPAPPNADTPTRRMVKRISSFRLRKRDQSAA